MLLVHLDKLDFYALADRIGEIGLLRSGQDRQIGWTGKEEGNMEGSMIYGYG